MGRVRTGRRDEQEAHELVHAQPSFAPGGLDANRLLRLQSAAGNAAVARAVRPSVQRDLAAYTTEHAELLPTMGEGPQVMETDTADAPGITAVTGPLVSAGKVSTRQVRDMVQFAGTGATQAEVVAALAAGGYPRAVEMASVLIDKHRTAVYSREEVSIVPGLIWDTELSRRRQVLETLTTRGLTGAEQSAASSVFGASLDYGRIVLDDAPVMGIGGYARTTPWTINFPNGTLAGGGPSMSWLIHELGHSWQYQRGVSLIETLYHAVVGVYDYGGEAALRRATAAGAGLSHFNTEQQADIACHGYEVMTGGRAGDLTVYRPYLDEFRSGRYR